MSCGPKIEVKKIANGYLLEVKTPFKKMEKSDEPVPYEEMYGEKEIFAADGAELGKKVDALIPMLDTEYKDKSEFDAAFESI